MARGGTVGGLMEVAETAAKEKVVRVAVLALRNIAEGVEGGDAARAARGAETLPDPVQDPRRAVAASATARPRTSSWRWTRRR